MVANLQLRLKAVFHCPVIAVFEPSLEGGWNTVEVQDNNGVFRRGAVVDILNDGSFVVDFGYPGRRAEVVEHGKVFRVDRGPPYLYSEIDVLIREFPNRPPAWYPALGACLQMHNGYPNDKQADVRVQFDNVLLSETISTKQLRMRPSELSLKQRTFEKHHFVRRSLDLLPAPRYGFSLESPDFRHLFQKILNNWEIYPVSLSPEKIVYVQKRLSRPLLLEDWSSICEKTLTMSSTLRCLPAHAKWDLLATTETDDSHFSLLLPVLYLLLPQNLTYFLLFVWLLTLLFTLLFTFHNLSSLLLLTFYFFYRNLTYFY
ncbi:uncharacterized protein LOC129596443 [Paramacrobiotus metropolitanus]|uniref:uncharacterized protein LOC129596443 n=1 Tax=Paramacrobiotus metropolitanus TaxID=2943436 RepID=UPI0024457D6E|nr:uncharacterized protein LOC129596443 [Paramacrobiotus metropolitanus]